MIEFIEDSISYNEFKDYLKEDSPKDVIFIEDKIKTKDVEVLVYPEFSDLFNYTEKLYPYSNSLIFGKDPTENIVSIEVKNDVLYLFKNNGEVEERVPTYWILASKPLDKNFKKLKGNNHYNYIRTFNKFKEYSKFRNIYSKKDIYVMWNNEESQMAYYGITQFKGLMVDEVSVLGFDIESSGLVRDETSKVFIITNTFKKNGKKESVQFIVDDYKDQYEMIEDWCNWVVEIDPDIITGHNIFGYDLDYLNNIMSLKNKKLNLGRDKSAAFFGKKPKGYRVDGAQSWDYYNCKIFGRHIIDGMFLAVKYDIGRNYESWGLKSIIEYEGLIKENRQFYDASLIAKNWDNPIEKEKIIDYCVDDGDDSISIFELMIPSFFYLTRSIPKPFQVIINGASGSWLNALFVRGYLQTKDSIPKADNIEHFEGAISYGVPGVYSNCFKQDVASLYPSIMRHYNVCEKRKDYKETFPEVVEYFTLERLKNKKIANDTKDPYYRALEQSQKIVINSLYGFMGATGLNFNSEKMASYVTEKGRDILNKALKWSTGEEINYWKLKVEGEKDIHENQGKYDLVNCDTDSIMIKKKDSSFWTKQEREIFLQEMNQIFPELILWEDDGYYDRVIVVKPKNYVLLEEGSKKIKIKGSSFKDAKKELAMKEMLQEITKGLVYEKDWYSIYENYLQEISNIEDISRWVTKLSISEKLLEGNDTSKKRKLEAIKDIDYQLGDKVYLFRKKDGVRPKLKGGEKQYYKKTGELMTEENIIYCLENKFNGDYHIPHYLKRVYATLEILKNVIDIERSPRYDLKSKYHLYEERYLKE
jgi:DNA polymerase elongation subunit (family B)